MITKAQLNILRTMARSGLAANMDVALGANVPMALLDDIDQMRAACERALGMLDAEGLEDGETGDMLRAIVDP